MNTITVEIEGALITAVKSSGIDLVPGDVYIAKRNTGWKLLTCKHVKHEGGWVIPVEPAYLYDLGECHKVISIA